MNKLNFFLMSVNLHIYSQITTLFLTYFLIVKKFQNQASKTIL